MGKDSTFKRMQEDFEEIQHMCRLLSDYRSTEFDGPVTQTDIEKWEEENDVRLPDMLRCWYMITSRASIVGGAYEIFMPVPAGEDRFVIGRLVDDGEDLFYSSDSDQIWSEFGGESEEYSDFEDFLSYIMMNLQDTAEGILGEDWEEKAADLK